MAKFAGALFAVLCFCNVQSWTVEASLLDGTMQQATDAIQNANSTMQKLQDQAQSALSNVTALANDAKSQASARMNCTEDQNANATAAIDTIINNMKDNNTKALQTVNKTSNSIITESKAVQEKISNASSILNIPIAVIRQLLAIIEQLTANLPAQSDAAAASIQENENTARSELVQLMAKNNVTC